MKSPFLLPLFIFIAGCIPYPARIIMPLEVKVVDAKSGMPIEGAQVLRIVCDVHDFDCSHASLDRGQTDRDGEIEMDGKRKWGLWFPAPGGFPSPNHQIAIWKSGYKAFVYSQYGDLDFIKSRTKRIDLKSVIKEVPVQKYEYDKTVKPSDIFSGGTIRLYRADLSFH